MNQKKPLNVLRAVERTHIFFFWFAGLTHISASKSIQRAYPMFTCFDRISFIQKSFIVVRRKTKTKENVHQVKRFFSLAKTKHKENTVFIIHSPVFSCNFQKCCGHFM